MRKTLGVTLFVVSLFAAVSALAQNPNYDVGPVWRVNYYHIKPGQGDAFWKDFRDNIKPVYETAKKEGWFTDYKAWVNPTVDHPGDWDVALGILYPNWAALDQLDTKTAPVLIKHYGSREAMLEATRKRSEFREVVASRLAREVTPK